MASVRDIKIAEALLILCIAYYVMISTLLRLRRYDFHYSRYGPRISQVYSLYFRNDWMDCRDAFHAVLCLNCCVMDKT